MPQYFKPGDTVPVSGQYRNTTTGYEVTLVKGEKFPPTPRPGQMYELVDRTRHKY
jgi:hypothetical protein